MKKIGMGSRLLAALLALTMIVSMIPLSVLAADGDISSGKTGLDTNIDTLDSISWPIKVYDYLNDGLLFEYASALDSSVSNIDGDAYGGGEMMPGDFFGGGMLLGNDYTVNSSESKEIYDVNAYSYWLKSKSGYAAASAQQGVGTAGAFKFLRLQPYKDYEELYDSTVPSLVVSDFKYDYSIYSGQKGSYEKDRVQYAVLIYRTNVDDLKLTMGVSDPEGSKTVLNYNLAATNDPNGGTVDYDSAQTVTLTKETNIWNFVVVDMNSGTAASRWNNGTAVTQIIMDTNMATEDQYLDLAYVAYFANKAEALRFAEKGTAFANNPGEYLPDQSYKENGTTKYKHWNMGNNTAFTMLYASSGGGWAGNSYTGGTNTWPNGYYSYQLGKHTGTSALANGTNSYRTKAKEMGYPVPDDIYFYSVSSNSSHDMSGYDFGYTLYNTIRTDSSAAVMTAGLLQNDLISVTGVDGKIYRIPEYKQSTVEYIALLLRQTLAIGQKDTYGNYNYNFVRGSVSSQFADAAGNKRDLATALREALGMTKPASGKGNYTLSSAAAGGSYAQTKARQELLIGPYAKVIETFKQKGLTFTYYDAAFYLMHNLFVDDSYNQLQNDYNYLILSKAKVTATGKEAFVFDAGFTTGNGDDDSKSAVQYNEKNGTISLSAALGKDQIEYSGGQKTTRYPFLPVQHPEGDYLVDTHYHSNGTPYFEEDGANGVANYGETYATRDYNYVMQANAEFVYHYQDDLFFQFQGDDDVYLFVNGELVLDIGAAHAVTSVDFSMNEYVLQAQKKMAFLKQDYGYRPDISDETFERILNEAVKNGDLNASQKDEYRRWHHLNLVDGGSYPIDFYYMERHGWGANMRVATNIVMTDPTMVTEKKAYQDGAEINYGGIVDPDKLIEYSFSITNEGFNKLYNLTFNDYDIGLTLSPKTGLSFNKDNVNGVTVSDARGQTLEASDLIVRVDGYKDDAKTQPVSLTVRFDGQNPNEELKQFLTDLTSNDGTDKEDNDDLFSGTGLWRHATVTIRGIYYSLTQEQIAEKQFNNAVFTTTNPAVDSEIVLNSEDTHQVRLIGDAEHIYQWAEHEVFFTREDLINWKGGALKVGSKNYTADQILLTTCRKDGTNYDFPDIVVRDYKNVTVNYLKPGTHLTFIKVLRDTDKNGKPDDIDGSGKVDEYDYLTVIPLAVYVTDIQDDIVVLDYGLKAELTGKNGITANDYITVPNLNTCYSIMGMTQAAPSYLMDTSNLGMLNYNRISFAPVDGRTIVCEDGTYEYTVDTQDDKLYFTPTDFMDKEYEIYVAVTIHELDAKVPSAVGVSNSSAGGYSIDITKEVQMYQKITVLPATVMYYENDFALNNEYGGIFYKKDNIFNGTGSHILMQGVDQSVNYGADQVYQTKDNAQISGNSMTAFRVTEYGKLAQFTFKGTGFEIISRTNAFDSASFVIVVQKDGTTVKTLPVITEFSNDANSSCQHTDRLTESLPTNGKNMFNGVEWLRYDPGADYGNNTVYFDNTAMRWGKVYAYTYGKNGDCNGKWPGTLMTNNGAGIYSLDLNAGATSIIFHDGAAQSAQADVSTVTDQVFDGFEWKDYVFETGSGAKTVYFDNTELRWDSVYIYAEGTNAKPGSRMSSIGRGIYSYELPAEATTVTFSNGTEETETFPVPADGSNLYDGKEWFHYDVEAKRRTRIVSFDNTVAGWKSVYVYTYSYDSTAIQWHWIPLEDVGNGIYSAKIPTSAKQVIFYDGTGCVETGKLPTEGSNWFDGSRWWYYDAAANVKYQKVFFDNAANKWENVHAYYEGKSGALSAPFPGDAMTDVSRNEDESVYCVLLPESANKITFNGSNHNVNGHCTVCGTYVGHVYYQNVCAKCGQKRLDYYLIGYINGADYGCEGDYQNMGQYKFENGKLTAMFKTDGYVFVKTTDNASFYMTNGYPGANVTSTYLYNTETTNGLKPDKLHVPGGVELTFTVVENPNGTLTLSYTTSNDDVTDLDKTVYFYNTDDWSNVNAYYWSATNATMVNWPGVAMTRTEDADPVYKMTLPAEAEYVIFNDGTGTQTMDLTVPADNMIYSVSGFNKGWSVYNPGKTTLAFDNTASKWHKVYVYYWSEQEQHMVEWPGDEMTAGTENIFTAAIPSNATKVLFHNGDGSQTADLDILKNGDTYIFGTGWASQDVGETVRTVYFKNTANWSNLHVYYWDANSEGNLAAWPGDAMIQQDGDVYKASIPAAATHVIFNNGNDQQTLNLELVDDRNLFVYDKAAAETVPAARWSVYGGGRLPDAPTTRTIYLTNPFGWSAPCAHYWVDGGDTTTWPGVLMTNMGGNRYSVTVPVETDFIIFNNNGSSQTGNLPLLEGLDVYDLSKATWSSTDPVTRTIYLVSDTGWGDHYAYFWIDGANLTTWPGVAMTKVSGNLYSVEVPTAATKIIFNNNGGTQTDDMDLNGSLDQYTLSTKTWSNSGMNQGDTTPAPIYYDNVNGWAKVYAYYWSASDNQMVTWPGVEMTRGADGVYCADIPGNARYVIFNDYAGNQTGDLTIPTNGANYYSCPAPSCGNWEAYEAQRVLYFDAGTSGWTNVNAYYWSANENMTTWPGAPMTKVSDTLYSITVPVKAEMVIFNNGSAQTPDLSITDANDKYSYSTGEWTNTTRTIYFEGTGTNSVRVVYSVDGTTVGKKLMTRVKNSIYSCVIPVDAKYVTFEDGHAVTGPVILSDDHDLYTAGGWTMFDPASDYRHVIYFENTQGWENAYIHYWGNDIISTTWPGLPMTFVDDRIYSVTIPSGATGVVFNDGKGNKQTVDLSVPAGLNLFVLNPEGGDGNWGLYTKTKTDAIHQVPAMRVDGLDLDTYTVEIYGMPTYTPDVDWTHMQDFVKPTYMYLDGIRIYQPMGSSNDKYAVTENGATFRELRGLILEGHAAVAAYNNGTKTYSGNVSWTENRNGVDGEMKKQYIGNQLSGIDDYLLLGPNNETYLNGNAQAQAVIFFVKETDAANHALQIAARGIDAGLFLGGASTGVNATLYHGVCIENPDGSIGYGWSPIDTLLSATEQYYSIDYKNCPYMVDESGAKIYQVALFVRSGMVSFTNVKFIGLDLQSNPVGTATEKELHNGLLFADDKNSGNIGATTSEDTRLVNNLLSIGAQMAATEWIEDTQQAIQLKYPALSFEDEVFYNVFFTIPGLKEQPVEMGLLMFDTLEEDGTIYDATAVISGVTSANGMYVARSLGVQAKDLGKTLYFRVFAQMADGSYVYSKAASYSARQYAKAVLEGNYSAETKALIAAMLKYGEAAQNYFGGVETVSDLINDDVNALVCDYRADLLQSAAKPDAAKAGCFAATATGFAKKSPAVSFDGAFAINYFFTPSTTVQGDMTLYYWNAEDYEGAAELTADNATGSMTMTPGDRYTAAITGIAAKDMDSTFYVAVVYRSNGQTYSSGVLAYSLAAYCKSMANAQGVVSDLAKATAVYGYYAKQLFG